MEKKGISGIVFLAMLTMLVDHLGMLFFPEIDLFRSIGRIAFPIFAWRLAMGFKYTKDRRAYFKRLLFFALISQLPYMFFSPGLEFNPFSFNQIAQFVLSFMVLWLLEKAKEKSYLYLPALLLLFLPDTLEFFYSDFSLGYGSYGIMMSLLFYYVESPLSMGIGYLLLNLYGSLSTVATWYGAPLVPGKILETFLFYVERGYLLPLRGLFFQWRSALALPFIWFEKRLPSLGLSKRSAYYFYPLHMVILILLYRLLEGLGVL